MKYDEIRKSEIFQLAIAEGGFVAADTYEVFLNIEDGEGNSLGVSEVKLISVMPEPESEAGEQVYVWLDDNGDHFEVYELTDDISFSVYRMVRDYLGCY